MRQLRRLLVLVAGAAMAVTTLAPVAGAAGGADRVGLDRAVAAGRLDRAVRAAVVARSDATALVTFRSDGPAADGVPGYLARLGAGSAIAPSDTAASTRAAIGAADRALEALRPSVSVIREYASFAVRLVRIRDEAALARLIERPEVVRVRTDTRRQPNLAQSLPLIGQPAAKSNGWTGAGTAVAVIDTGVDWKRDAFYPGAGGCTAVNSPAGCRVVATKEIAPADGQRDDATLHGTNVAGIVLGVAPDTRILAVDVFDGDYSQDSYVLAAIDWVIANRATYQTRAINLSLGGEREPGACDASLPDYAAAFASVRDHGMLPVVAAGNIGYVGGVYTDGIATPACVSEAVAVGAVYDGGSAPTDWGDCTNGSAAADRVVCWSQAGVMLDLLAPGVLITAAGLTMAGTSQAAPHVAGAVAALWDARPSATPGQVEAALVGAGKATVDTRNGRTYPRLSVSAAGAELLRGPTWSPPSGAGPAKTSNSGGGLARSLDGTTEILHAVGTTDVVGGVPVADDGPYQSVSYLRRVGTAAWTSKRLNPTAQHGSRTVVAASGARVHVAWVQTASVDGTADPAAPSVLWIRSSADHGVTWGPAVRLSPTTGRVDYPTIAASGSRVHVTWTDANGGAIRTARSTNGGGSFGAPTSLGTANLVDGDGFGRFAWPAVAVTGSTVAVAWLADSDPAGRVRARISTDAGITWGGTTTVATSGAWSVSAAAVSGRVGLAWDGGATVRYREWAAGAWGTIRTVAPFRAPGGYWPVVALQGTTRVGVAWIGCVDGWCARSDLRWSESSTNGTSWSPQRLILDPATSALRRGAGFPSVIWASSTKRQVLAGTTGTSGSSPTYRLYLTTGTGSP
jgi:subtilisin family serine protease